MMKLKRSLRTGFIALCLFSAGCSSPRHEVTATVVPPQSSAQKPVAGEPRSVGAPSLPSGEPISIRFDAFSKEKGLSVSITVVGDGDGQTTFSNQPFFSYEAPQYASDVRVVLDGKPLIVIRDKSGWTVNHAPQARLTVSYWLAPSSPTKIDAGVSEWVRPDIANGRFHLIGDTAWLLPKDRAGSDPILLSIDVTGVVDDRHFASSFGPGATLRAAPVTRRDVGHAVYVGGAISLSVHDTPTGRIGVASSGLGVAVRENELRNDAVAVIEAERSFMQDSQPWYLVSVHGGPRDNPEVKLGGGTGLTNSFVMFVTPDLDFANPEDREQFRWVLAHEYFHVWNGLKLRVANLPNNDQDDTSVYWFSEGFTEFYAMRLLTRAGLQTPLRAVDVLDDKLRRYAKNSKRDVSTQSASRSYYSDPDADQLPYLRGYLAAWKLDIAIVRASGGSRSLDDAMLRLVKRAKSEPDFRVDNAFLVPYLTEGLPAHDAESVRRFIVSGGPSPLDATSFSPCLRGEEKSSEEGKVLLFYSKDASSERCFRH